MKAYHPKNYRICKNWFIIACINELVVIIKKSHNQKFDYKNGLHL